MITDLSAAPVLAEPQTQRIASDASQEKHRSGEARESITKGNALGLSCPAKAAGEKDSRGGAQKNSKRGRPRLPDDQLSPDARRMRKVYARRRLATGSGAKGNKTSSRYQCGKSICGYEDRAEQLLSDFEVDVAVRYFWGKRGRDNPPGVEHAGINPSAQEYCDDAFGYSHNGEMRGCQIL